MKLILNTFTFFVLTLAWTNVATINYAFADDGLKEKTEEAANDTKRVVKKTARKIDDKTCKLVHGVMKCTGKKIKNAGKNLGDKAEDMAD